MAAALALAGYALIVAWCLPAPLARLTRRGASPRLGMITWLAAMGSAITAAALALFFLLRTVWADWPRLTVAVCREVAGNACTPVIYRSALYEAGLAALLAVASLGAAIAAWRYGRRVRRSRRQTVAHARAARIVGRSLPGTGAVVLEDPRPAAYCAAGTIVVTRGALDVLDPAQLVAVLAHERAHLSGRHHAVALATRGLDAAFPSVPLFARGAREVARLAEMSADDAAVRAIGRRPGRCAGDRSGGQSSGRALLVAALIAIATGQVMAGGTVVPRTALAAAAYAVSARVERMLQVPSRSRVAACVVALASTSLSLVLLPVVIAGLAG
jgi:Zn-dependent protease with chaperone function